MALEGHRKPEDGKHRETERERERERERGREGGREREGDRGREGLRFGTWGLGLKLVGLGEGGREQRKGGIEASCYISTRHPGKRHDARHTLGYTKTNSKLDFQEVVDMTMFLAKSQILAEGHTYTKPQWTPGAYGEDT